MCDSQVQSTGDFPFKDVLGNLIQTQNTFLQHEWLSRVEVGGWSRSRHCPGCAGTAPGWWLTGQNPRIWPLPRSPHGPAPCTCSRLVPNRPGGTRQTGGPVMYCQVVQVGLLLLRLGQGAEQGLHVLLQSLGDVRGPEEGGLRDSTGHQQPHLPADAGDGGQPAQVSETFPQEQHQEGPSHFHGNCREACLGFLCLTGLTRSLRSELWTSSGSGKSLSRGRLQNRQCMGPLSHGRGPLGRPVVGIHVQLSFVAVLPIRYLDCKCSLCTEPRSMNAKRVQPFWTLWTGRGLKSFRRHWISSSEYYVCIYILLIFFSVMVYYRILTIVPHAVQ